MKILKCRECGKIVFELNESDSLVNCCSKDMMELKVNDVEASFEKHIPVIEVNNCDVSVKCGEVLHPMEEAHYIEFMVLETDKGYQFKYLKPGDQPICNFVICDNEVVKCAYAYCNLHGLWVKNYE